MEDNSCHGFHFNVTVTRTCVELPCYHITVYDMDIITEKTQWFDKKTFDQAVINWIYDFILSGSTMREFVQKMPQPQTTYQHTAPQGRDKEHIHSYGIYNAIIVK